MRPASYPQTGADVSQGPLQARRTGLPRRPAAEAGESQQAADGHGLVLDLFFFVVFGGAEPATVGRARPAESQFHFLLVVESVVPLHQSLHHNSLQVGLYLILLIYLKLVELKKLNGSHSVGQNVPLSSGLRQHGPSRGSLLLHGGHRLRKMVQRTLALHQR
jgi:hypothetical protein